jgi:hypothetical protein
MGIGPDERPYLREQSRCQQVALCLGIPCTEPINHWGEPRVCVNSACESKQNQLDSVTGTQPLPGQMTTRSFRLPAAAAIAQEKKKRKKKGKTLLLMVLLGLVLVATGLVGMTRLPLLQRRLPLDENALHPGAAAPPAPLTGLALWPTSPAAWLAALEHRTGAHGQVLDGGDAAFITVRAPRAAGGANIVLHARPDGHSAQLLAAMAAALSQAPHLARDIVFLLSPQAATLARLPSVSGTLAAISLNITRPSMHHLELSIGLSFPAFPPFPPLVHSSARTQFHYSCFLIFLIFFLDFSYFFSLKSRGLVRPAAEPGCGGGGGSGCREAWRCAGSRV